MPSRPAEGNDLPCLISSSKQVASDTVSLLPNHACSLLNPPAAPPSLWIRLLADRQLARLWKREEASWQKATAEKDRSGCDQHLEGKLQILVRLHFY